MAAVGRWGLVEAGKRDIRSRGRGNGVEMGVTGTGVEVERGGVVAATGRRG